MSNTRAFPSLALQLILLALLVLAAPLLAVRPAHAQMLELRPVQLQFSREHPSQAFALINRAALPATVQVRVFKWSQGQDGKDVLTPTQDMIVSPPFVQLDGGDSQVVRVRFLGAAQADEGSYRLIIDQLPPPRIGSGVRTALRLSMPAFVQPLAPRATQVSWVWGTDAAGASVLSVINKSAAHTRVSDLKITLPSGQPFALPAQGSAYILSGATHRWTIDGSVISPSKPRLPSIQVAGNP